MLTFNQLLGKLKAFSAHHQRRLSRERIRRELARLPPHLADDIGLTAPEPDSRSA
ncbi:DUF1127 domain-containing protein [Rhizobium sp. S152]|uniref:DUF1127 domain-containing protein n=1 Tax=Rhizobium sp. S152 TaxID=3055038 RepID=UPI0025A9A30E|nr:DUF1127 domain-containing protein [Rhizobium sp. S152]MDM9628414.1 DUF1127 domain-containing protein [Rhizobium sp. S152]